MVKSRGKLLLDGLRTYFPLPISGMVHWLLRTRSGSTSAKGIRDGLNSHVRMRGYIHLGIPASTQIFKSVTRNIGEDESGSISVLIVGLFAIALTLSVGILDLSDAFLAKRELIQIAEEATQSASHNISLQDYYSGAFENNSNVLVPVDCQRANDVLRSIVTDSRLRNRPITIADSSCDGSSVSVTLRSTLAPIVDFSILHSAPGGDFVITASSSSESVVSANP